jgi:hypothetical protein
VIVASRYEESELFCIDGVPVAAVPVQRKKQKQVKDQRQLSLV